MPTVVRKTGSIFILGTYVTSLALAVTYFFGSEVMASRDDRIGTEYVKEQMHDLKEQSVNLNDQMSEFIQFSYENRIMISTQQEKILGCKEDMAECKEFINKAR